MMTSTKFKELGGKPSGKWNSSYSEICKLLDVVENLDIPLSYLDKKQRDARRKLNNKLARFHPNDHGNVEKKKKEINAVRTFQRGMDGGRMEDLAKVSELLDKMANNKRQLIHNTGKGLIKKFSSHSGGLSLVFTDAGAFNAMWSAKIVTINKPKFWASENFATAILVHEYHHILTKRAGEFYADEFVAHWKQYQAMNLNKTAKYLNNWLLDDPTGYNLRKKPNLFKGVEFDAPEKAGTMWTNYRDNKG
jgi:hypothetical protein